MEFFYLQGDHEDPIVFSDLNGQAIFELLVVKPDVKDIPDTHIYVAPSNQLKLIAQAITTQFSGLVNIKAFSGKFISENNLIKPRLLGKSILFGLDLVTNEPLSKAIESWKADCKDGVSIAVLGGYGSDFTRSLISASIMASALADIGNAGLTMGVDSYVEKNNADSGAIRPFLQPLNTVNSFPISMHLLNGYDAIFVTDEKSMIELGVESSDNYHDFYAEVFGIKKYSYGNYFLLNKSSRDALKQTLIRLKDYPDQKVILIDFSSMSNEYANKLALDVSRRFPNAMLVTLESIEFSDNVSVINLMHLTSDLSNLGCFISLIDGIIGTNSFYIHLGASYGVPTIVMTRSKTKNRMFQYYQHTEVLVDMDNLFNESNDLVMSELSRFEGSFKDLWDLFDKSNAHQKLLQLETENKDKESSIQEETADKSESNNALLYSILTLALAISVGGIIGYLCI